MADDGTNTVRYLKCRNPRMHSGHFWSVESGATIAENCGDINTPYCRGVAPKAVARKVITINYPETGDPGTIKHLLNLVEKEAIENAFREKAAEMRSRFPEAAALGPGSFAGGWLEAVNYFDPDHQEV